MNGIFEKWDADKDSLALLNQKDTSWTKQWKMCWSIKTKQKIIILISGSFIYENFFNNFDIPVSFFKMIRCGEITLEKAKKQNGLKSDLT